MYALVDCNNFYVSCERAFQPQLRKRPVVVLSNNDGCVISRSNEAKALGVEMGAPEFKYREFFRQHNVAVLSSNYPLYGDMSNRVMSLLSGYSPEVEVYSIDEAFLRFRGFDSHFRLDEYGRNMRSEVTRGTGIPVSVGFAPTKALAKVANRIAKKFPERTGSVHVIDDEARRIKALKWLPIGDVWGIGPAHARRLAAQGLRTAYDFAAMDEAWVKKNMTVVELRLLWELRGIPCLDIEQPQDKKHIATTRSFEKDYHTFTEVAERVATFAVSCAAKLRRQNSDCNSLMVFLHTNGFKADMPQYSRNIVVNLPFATNSGIEITRFAVGALRRIFKDGYGYKKAGVIVMDLTPSPHRQIGMFANADPRHVPLMKAVDDLNRRIGTTKVKLASQNLTRTWIMRQEKLSPRFTTEISEVFKVKA